jgi:hypothetical protein
MQGRTKAVIVSGQVAVSRFLRKKEGIKEKNKLGHPDRVCSPNSLFVSSNGQNVSLSWLSTADLLDT